MRFAFLSANLNAAAEQASSHGGRDAYSVKYFSLAVMRFARGSSLETARRGGRRDGQIYAAEM